MKRRAFCTNCAGFLRGRRRQLPSVVWAVVVAMVVVFAGVVPASAESAASLYHRGQAAEARESYDAAFTYYQKAFEKAPGDLRYKTTFHRVRVLATTEHLTKGNKLAAAGDAQGALAEYLRALEIDPSNEAAQQQVARLHARQGEQVAGTDVTLAADSGQEQQLNEISAPAEIHPLSTEPLTLHMSEDAKTVYQAVGKAAGVNVLFDPDYTSKRIQVDLNGVSMLDALRIVGTLSNTFYRVVTSNTIFVAQNNRGKRQDMDEQAVQTFYLTNAWQQNDLTDVQNTLRNVMPNTKVYGVPSQNAIVMRGTPDELMLAQKLINDLDKSRPEVVVDIAVLEVSKNWERNLGLSWPSSASVALQTSTTSTTSGSNTTSTTTTPTIYDLKNIKASDLAVTIGSATANMLLSDSNTKVLQNPRIRCTDQQKATMKIGERIPTATGSYSSGVASTVTSSLVNTQFQYLDVGVNIEVTPTVHYDHDVTLKMKIEVSSQSGSVTISSVTEPIIAQKTSEQVIRLREGEASVLSGILNREEVLTWGGLPGLSSIPGIKYLFGSKDKKITDDEIVFLVIPHIVRTPSIDSINLRTVDTGVGQSIDLRRIPTEEQQPVKPIAPVRSTVGVVPTTNPENAAAGALKQMRQAASESAGPVERSRQTLPAAPLAAQPAVPVSNIPAGAMALLPGTPAKAAVGSVVQVPVTMQNAADVTAVPMQISYDASKLTLVNVNAGDLLSRDGQSVALVHRDDGPGTITLNVSRPPGTAGVAGSGVVCVLSFQAKTAGESQVVVTRPMALNSTSQPLTVVGGRTTVQVQ